MIDPEELVDNLSRSMKTNNLESIQLGVNKLKTLSPKTWQKYCSSSQPLIQISDSVLNDVKIILNINQTFNDMASGNKEIAQIYPQLEELKAAFTKITQQISKAKIWMDNTETDRWLQQLMFATKQSPDERKVLADKFARIAVINRKKQEKIAHLSARMKELRAKSRENIEQKWLRRVPAQKQLNEQQLKATRHNEGRLVITAGPGSGKTHVLVERMNSLIEQGCQPSRILMLTFTVKATNEMASRVEKRLSDDVFGLPEITNFNGFCKKMIEADYQNFGFTKSPFHIDPKFTNFLLDDLTETGIDDDLIDLIQTDERIKRITMRLDNLLHNRCTDAGSLITWFEDKKLTPLEQDEAETIAQGNKPSKTLEEYRLIHAGLRLVNPLRNYIRNGNGLTFGDQITLFHQRLSSDPSYLAMICNNYDHVLVDEFQDNNLAQGEIVKLLSNHLTSTCVVGDPNQAIFRFRGANVRNLQDFLQAFENTSDITKIDLDTCYRHSQNIIDISDDLIDKSKSSITRAKVRTGWINEDETKVSIHTFIDEASEAVEHAKWLQRKQLLGYEYDEMVILARSLKHVEILTNHLKNLGVPYVSTSSGTLFEDDLSVEAGMLLRACTDPVRNVQAVQYLLNSGFMGVLKEDAAILSQQNRRTPQKLIDSIINSKGLFSNPEALTKFHNFINEHSIKNNESLNEWMFRVLRNSGFIAEMLNRGPDSQISKLISILSQELVNAGNFLVNTAKFGVYLTQLMEGKIELEIPQISKPNHVVISTIHRAKGLEWHIVVLPSLDKRKLPGKQIQERAEDLLLSEYYGENTDAEIEDELVRLYYVGVTRVIDELLLSRPLTRTDKSSPAILFLTAAEHYPVIENNIMHHSLLDNPLTPGETNLLNIRKNLERSIDNIGIERESEDLKLSIRALLTYHLEKLAKDERSLSSDTRKLISDLEKTVGRIKYNEFHNEELDTKQPVWIPDYYTWSMLRSYRNCPRDFAFTYVHKLITNQSKNQTRGNIVHSIIEEIGCLQERIDMNQLDEIIEQKINLYRNTIPMLLDEEIEEISLAIKQWYQSPRSMNQVVGIEKSLEFTYAGRKFLGKVDRIEIDGDGKLRMIDFKTGKPNNAPGTSGHEQLLLYSHGWKENFGSMPDVISYDFVMHDAVIDRDVNQIALQKGLARLIPLIEGIERNDFSVRPGKDSCKFCNNAILCNIKS
ncbi:MAG: hypothetical protein CMB55_06320 [Euryarchaeota archaeon]|nr:hypothetical protein [Euryarchaeota archaeon]